MGPDSRRMSSRTLPRRRWPWSPTTSSIPRSCRFWIAHPRRTSTGYELWTRIDQLTKNSLIIDMKTAYRTSDMVTMVSPTKLSKWKFPCVKDIILARHDTLEAWYSRGMVLSRRDTLEAWYSRGMIFARHETWEIWYSRGMILSRHDTLEASDLRGIRLERCETWEALFEVSTVFETLFWREHYAHVENHQHVWSGRCSLENLTMLENEKYLLEHHFEVERRTRFCDGFSKSEMSFFWILILGLIDAVFSGGCNGLRH